MHNHEQEAIKVYLSSCLLTICFAAVKKCYPLCLWYSTPGCSLYLRGAARMVSQNAVLILLALATCSGIVQGQRTVDTDFTAKSCIVGSYVLKKVAPC